MPIFAFGPTWEMIDRREVARSIFVQLGYGCRSHKIVAFETLSVEGGRIVQIAGEKDRSLQLVANVL